MGRVGVVGRAHKGYMGYYLDLGHLKGFAGLGQWVSFFFEKGLGGFSTFQ